MENGWTRWRNHVGFAVVLGVIALVTMHVDAALTPEATPFNPPARSDGRVVEVGYTGSDCQDGSKLQAEEEADRVVLTVVTWEWATACNDMGVPYTVSTTLTEPLGDRTVVDGACLRPEGQRFADCRTG